MAKIVYFIYCYDEPHEGTAVVATSAKEARKLRWRSILGTDSFLDVRAKLIRRHVYTDEPIDVSDKPVGYEFPLQEGIDRGVYLDEEGEDGEKSNV